MGPTVVPAKTAVAFNKVVGESVGDSVGNRTTRWNR
jgi:hypothetical protein